MTSEFHYFGRSEKWYQDLVQFSQAYLDVVRLHQAGVTETASPKAQVAAAQSERFSLIPPSVMAELETFRTPEEIFSFLNARISQDTAGAFADGKLPWLVDASTRLSEDLQPLVLMALTHSVHEVVPNLAWIGTRVGTVMSEYVEALEVIYQAETGTQISKQDLENAKIHRDGIEYFCNSIFGKELKQLRTYLARLVPAHFLYRWEELNDQQEIVLKDLKKPMV